MQKLIFEVTSQKVGYSYLQNCEDPNPITRKTMYIVPTYRARLVKVNPDHPGSISADDVVAEFEVVRFGVHNKVDPNTDRILGTTVVGLKDPQDRLAKGWVGGYGTSCGQKDGAWKLGTKPGQQPGDYLLHDGPQNPRNPESSAKCCALGCIEVVGKGEWDRLDKAILDATGARNHQEIVKNKALSVLYGETSYPGLYTAAQKQAFLDAYFKDASGKGVEPPVFRDYSWLKPNSGLEWLGGLMCSLFEPSPAQAACDLRPGDCGTRELKGPKAEQEKQRADPLVLDLDGDGIETTIEGRSWAEGKAFFDHNADGFAERTGWVSGADGLLVMDRNGDGIINNGKELFGSGTPLSAGGTAASGFQALSDLDSNHDGKIDAADAAFSELRIWQDSDSDGYSRSYDLQIDDASYLPSELHTLAELGIQSISLTPTAPGSGTDAQGNTQNRVGSFTWTDGSTGQIAEYTFQTNTAYTIATEWVDVPDDIAALPDLPGYGVVPRLQQAMARDTTGTIKSHVQMFASATTRAGRESALQDILYAWTGSSNIDPANGRDGLSGPRAGVLSACSFQTCALKSLMGREIR